MAKTVAKKSNNKNSVAPTNNAAKFAFFYMLSLVALIFMALSTGMIIFQIINKKIVDLAYNFPGMFDSGVMKFAISAIIIAAPIYYITTWQINKNLQSGELDRDSGIRKWLTYFILFASSVVMLGWLIATVYSFLDGELTTKFILKSLTAMSIAVIVFSYYFYDIKREKVEGVKDDVVRYYFIGTLALVIFSIVSAFFFVESPMETRARKQDNAILEKFDRIDNAVNTYYAENRSMPVNLEELVDAGISKGFLQTEGIQDPLTKEKFIYNLTSSSAYQLCATFKISNKDIREVSYNYFKDRWPHDAGYQCLTQKVRVNEYAPKPLY